MRKNRKDDISYKDIDEAHTALDIYRGCGHFLGPIGINAKEMGEKNK